MTTTERIAPPPPVSIMTSTRHRLLTGAGDDLTRHHEIYGPLPVTDGSLIDVATAAGLTGRGGAAFPVGRKLAVTRNAATRRRRPVAVANGAEGEPLSRKDVALLTGSPHLVLDGLTAAARAVGATDCFLYAPPALVERLEVIVGHRAATGWDKTKVTVVGSGDRFVDGEASAVVDRLDGGVGIPRDRRQPLAVSGLRGRPTVVQNVETLAHLATIARFGSDWFRSAGTPDEPGTMIVTLSGASGIHGVVETPLGTPLATVLSMVPDLAPEVVSGVLVGGFHGTWVHPGRIGSLALSQASLGTVGAAPGAGIIRYLLRNECGLAVTAGIVDHLAAESAGQCGPCMFGLPALADATHDLLTIGGPARANTVARLAATIDQRGACSHPDGTARMVRSALRVFARDVDAHARGRCIARGRGL